MDNDRAAVSQQDLQIEPVEIVKKVDDTDLTMLIEKVDGNLLGHLYYSYAYIESDEAIQILHQFEQLMKNGPQLLEEPLLNLCGYEPAKKLIELDDDIF